MKNTILIYYILFLLLFMGGKVKAQDWPNLNKYQNENTKLAPPEPGKKRILFIGDSITEMWSTTDPSFFLGKPYINRGIGGQTTPQILVRFRADAIALQPAVIVLLAGINDIAGNTGPSTIEMISDNIFSMAELAKANNIKIILCSVLPAYDFPWKPNQNPAEKVIALNKMIKEYADAHNIIYLDYYSALVDDKKGLKAIHSGDGVHPNKLGYEIMKPLAEKAIAKALSKE